MISTPCPGYWYGGNYSYLPGECPELKRRSGCRPGGDKGYPEGWDKACPTCRNVGHYHGHPLEMAIVSRPDGSYSSWGPVWNGPNSHDQFMVLGNMLVPGAIEKWLWDAVIKGWGQGLLGRR